MQPSRAGFAYSFIYACEEPHKYRVREIRPAWQVAVARAAVGVGRVRQAQYCASLSFHGEGEGAPSFHQWVLISRLALDLYNLVNLHPAASCGAPRVDSTLSLQNGFPGG